MNIVTVAPISREVMLPELTYFTSSNPTPGSIISVPIRSNIVSALVLAIDRAGDKKITLRKGQRTLRKIAGSEAKIVFTESFLAAVEEISKFFLCSLGQTIDTFAPKFIYETTLKKSKVNNVSRLNENIKALAASREDRISFYKIYIREQFAKGRSVFIHAPHHVDGSGLFNRLSGGIESYSFLLHSDIPPKKAQTDWGRAVKEVHPILFVGTSKFLALPRHDIGTYIIESDSKSHKSINRPFLDSRFFIKSLARKSGASVIMGDTTLSLETYALVNEGQVELLGNRQNRIRHSADIEVADLNLAGPKSKIKFSVFGDIVEEEIRKAVSQKERVFIFCNRKGLAPTTICGDCGTTLDCPTCHVPLVLVAGDDKREFQCFHCKKIYKAETRCSNCKSWKLYPLGIGIEKVVEEVKRLFPDTKIFKVESGTTKTSKQVLKTVKDFYDSKEAILIGTEQVIPYLHKPVSFSIIVSIDNMLSLPDYALPERLFSLILYIYELTEKRLMIQTRKPDSTILEFLKNKDALGFQNNELKIRKEYNYPPYGTFIKISLRGKELTVKEGALKLAEELTPWSPVVTPAFLAHKKGYFSMHVILKLPKSNWPNQKLAELLKSLPPSYIIDVNPQSLL